MGQIYQFMGQIMILHYTSIFAFRWEIVGVERRPEDSQNWAAYLDMALREVVDLVYDPGHRDQRASRLAQRIESSVYMSFHLRYCFRLQGRVSNVEPETRQNWPKPNKQKYKN
jgi:hypothetical protein